METKEGTALDSRTFAKVAQVARKIWPEVHEAPSLDPMVFPGAGASELAREHQVLGLWLVEPRQQKLRILSRRTDDGGGYWWMAGQRGAKAPVRYQLPSQISDSAVARARTVLALEERACWLRSLDALLSGPRPTGRSSTVSLDASWLSAMARDLDGLGSKYRVDEAGVFLRFQERLRKAGAVRDLEPPWPPVARILRPLRTAEDVPADVVEAYMGVLEYYRRGVVYAFGMQGLFMMEAHRMGGLIQELNLKFGIEMTRSRVRLISAADAKPVDAKSSQKAVRARKKVVPTKGQEELSSSDAVLSEPKASKRVVSPKSKAVPRPARKKAPSRSKRS